MGKCSVFFFLSLLLLFTQNERQTSFSRLERLTKQAAGASALWRHLIVFSTLPNNLCNDLNIQPLKYSYYLLLALCPNYNLWELIMTLFVAIVVAGIDVYASNCLPCKLIGLSNVIWGKFLQPCKLWAFKLHVSEFWLLERTYYNRQCLSYLFTNAPYHKSHIVVSVCHYFPNICIFFDELIILIYFLHVSAISVNLLFAF